MRWARRTKGGAVLALGLAAALAGLPACSGTSNPGQSSNPNQRQVKVSPMPYGVAYRGDAPKPLADIQGRNLDEVIAYVEGRPITRRRLVRESGGRPPGIDDEAFERQLQSRLRSFVIEELFVREAQRIGIQVPEQALDEAIAERRTGMEEEASKAAGRPVRFAEVLADRGITEVEFREMFRRGLLQAYYMRRLKQGLGPMRPQLEMEVSPAEVKRIYREHPDQFDVKPGVKFAVFQVKFSRFLTADRPVAEAEAAMTSTAASIADAFRRGDAPAEIARRTNLGEGEWKVTPKFQERSEQIAQLLGKDGADWLFAPDRRARDAVVLEGPRGEGPIILGIVEVQAPHQRTWDEIRDEIVKMVRIAREERTKANLIIQMVAQRNVVWPQALADAIISDARNLIAEIDRHPIYGSARFQ